MNPRDPGAPVGPAFLVIQLARFGDLIQTGRLVSSLQSRGDVHLLVDRSLADLARLVYPGVTVHGLAAHGTHGPDILPRVHDDLEVVAGTLFHRVYNLNFSGMNFALAAMFPARAVRGYRQEAAHEKERDEPELFDLHRLTFQFNARHYGRLRELVDFINLPQNWASNG